MAHEAAYLSSQITQLQNDITAAYARAELFKERTSYFSNESSDQQDAELKALDEK